MKNSELNQMTIQDLRDLNKRVVEMIKLKMLVEGKLNADNLSEGMLVKYKGSTNRIQGDVFKIMKINKVNAQCKNTKSNTIWNIKLANLEPFDSVNTEIFENNPESYQD